MATALPDFEVAETAVPETTVTRTPEDNPFTGKFPTAGWDSPDKNDRKALTIVLPAKTEDDEKGFNKVISLAQNAGRAVDTTTRVKRQPVDKNGNPVAADKATHIRLTMWSAPAIKRPRKDTTDTTAE